MTAVTAPSGRSLAGKLSAVIAARRPAQRRGPSRLAVFAAKAREHVVTVAALGAFDLSAFQVNIPHLGAAPGWAAVCVSLLALDFAVRG